MKLFNFYLVKFNKQSEQRFLEDGEKNVSDQFLLLKRKKMNTINKFQ